MAAYDAFISYAHAGAGDLAASLQRWLERFATPWYRPRGLRIFRDYTSLAASADLGGAITAALAASRHFVLLASPEAAGSVWVGREIQWWRDNRRPEDVLVVLTGGELHWDDDAGDWDLARSTALPPAARGMFAREPLWVDLTEYVGAAPRRSDPRLVNAVAQLAAPLRGVDKDTLVGEHLTLHRRAVRQRLGGVIALCVLLVAALVGAYAADRQRHAANEQRQAAASRRLVAEVAAEREGHPGTALLLGIAAMSVAPNAAAQAELLQTMTGTLYAGTLRGHRDALTGVAFAPDASHLVTSSRDGEVAFWDVSRPAIPVREGVLTGTASDLTGMSVDAAGRTVVIGSRDQTASVWDVSSRSSPRSRATFDTGRPVLAVAISPDGSTMATGGPSGRVSLWDLADPAHPRRRSELSIDSGNTVVLAFAPDGRTLAVSADNIRSGVDDSVAVLWDVTDRGRPVRTATLTGHEGVVTAIAFDRGGTRIVTGGDDWNAIVWDRTDPRHPVRKQTLANHSGTITGAAFSPDVGRLVTSGEDRIAILWERDDKGAYHGRTAMRGHDGPLTAAAFGAGGTIATASADRTAMLWTAEFRGHPTRLAELAGTTGTVGVFSPDGDTLVTDDAGFGGDAILWDVTDPARPRRRATLDTGRLEDAAFDAAGRTLATGSFGGPTVLWDGTEPVATLDEGDSGGGYSLAFSPDGRILAIGSRASAVPGTVIWDVADRTRPVRLAELSEQTDGRVSVAFSPDGRTLATGGAEGTTVLWDMSDPAHPARTATLSGHVGTVNDVAFAPDGTLATAGDDDATMLWDVGAGQRRASLGEHTAGVNSVAYSPDGRVLATGSSDARFIFWNLVDRAHPVGMDAVRDDESVWKVSFSPDGGMLAAGDGSRSLTLWDTSELRLLTADTVARACSITGRGLDQGEWARYLPDVPYRRTCPADR